MDFEQKQTLKRRAGLATLFGVVLILWITSTLASAWIIAEYKAHGAEHAYVKQLMAKDAQHEAEHAALRQVIQIINQQLSAQQAQPHPAAAPGK